MKEDTEEMKSKKNKRTERQVIIRMRGRRRWVEKRGRIQCTKCIFCSECEIYNTFCVRRQYLMSMFLVNV